MTRRWAALAPAALILAGAPSAHADADLPDFDAYPKASAKDFTVRDTLVYSVRGFRTPSGIYCTSSAHRGIEAANCYGPFVGAPNGGNWVVFSGYTDGVPQMSFARDNTQAATSSPDFEGHPIPMLPPGVVYEFDNLDCMYGAGYLLACVMAKGPNQKGFVATSSATVTYGD